MKIKLQQTLDTYLANKHAFDPYHSSMRHIVGSKLFGKQLQEILIALEDEESGKAKSFKLYLDTIIINMQSKISKYKPSPYFESGSIKEIENQGYVIPFLIDEDENTYVLLGIFWKNESSGNTTVAR